MNKNIYQLFFSVVVGIGLGFALTYALNVYANSSLTSSLAVDWGAVFNNAGSNKVIIDNSGNVTVSGTVSAAEMQIGASNVCRADGTNCPAGTSYSAGSNLSLLGTTFNVVSSPVFNGLGVGGNTNLGSVSNQGWDTALTVNGNISSRGTYQFNSSFNAVPYTFSTERYVAEVSPAMVGVVMGLDTSIINRLCQDIDGCDVTVQMLNWDGLPQYPLGTSVASRQEKLFIGTVYEGSGMYTGDYFRYWRFANNDVNGIDGNGIVSDFQIWGDCYLTDGETSVNSNNARSDNYTTSPNGSGFGLLNAIGSNPDATTGCRVTFED